MKVLHLITGLNTGGAEMMLYKLISRMDRDQFDNKVISLTDIGPVGKKIKGLGVPVYSLGMRRGWKGLLSLKGFLGLLGLVRKYKPDVIQSWMYHANLLGILLHPFFKNIPIVWNIRHTVYNLNDESKITKFIIKVGTKLSRIPKVIIFNSFESLKRHQGLGYKNKNMIVIPNGFDTSSFKPDDNAYCSVREELGLNKDATLIGLVARYHPMKDHINFLKALALIIRGYPNVHAILIGDDINETNKELMKSISELNISKNVHLLGRRDDIPRLTASFDISSSSSSYGEAFPNVIGEAMACGVPCVVTDVGDSARIIGNTGIVVPPKNPEALANGLRKMIKIGEKERKRLGILARKRIIENYSIEKIVKQYERLYEEICVE